MTQTILVTGGAGFIGANFVHRWHSRHPQDRILVLDKLTYAANPKHLEGLDRVELIRADIQNGELVAHLLERHAVGKLFHFAAESHVDRSISGPAAFVQTNLLGTFALLEAARTVWAGDSQTRFLHVSTDEVFGSLGDTGYFSETTPYAPNSPYSSSKAGSDHLVRAYHHTYGLNVVTTNCSNNYGPRQHPEKLIPLAISRMVNGEAVPVYGDGQNVRDWLYVEDHCAAIERVMEAGNAGEVYCVGGDNEWKNLDLLHLLADQVDEALGRAAGTSRGLLTFVKDRAGHDRRYAIDASKLKRDLGWTPAEQFPSGLKKTIAWYLAALRK
ncbi:MAG: dTDP-glucose 4,6-dehydratase [Acidobacteria bacterium]|nr:dTDP-glucose 4,6-dehydratase [Acidobacteriota bacterium]